MNNRITNHKILSKIDSRHVVTIVAAVLLFLLYVMIFGLSAQDGEQSGGISYKISEKCVDFVDAVAGKHWTGMIKKEMADFLEHPIRKLAHFTEYTCMGILVYLMWRPWKKRGKGLYGLVILWVFLSASGDEIHQRFVPGRFGSFMDVCLDTCGGVFGVIICSILERMYLKMKRKKDAKKVQKNLHNHDFATTEN